MSWGPVPGAVRYHIYLDGSLIADVTGNSCVVSVPESPGLHRVQISAVSATGEESGPGPPGFIPVMKLGMPEILAARGNPTVHAIDIVWEVVPGASTYDIYRSEGDGDVRLLASGVMTVFRDRTAVPGVEYSYSIRARSPRGEEGALSKMVPATILPEESAAPGERRQNADAVLTREQPLRKVLTIEKVGDGAIQEITFLGVGRGGEVWLVTPASREVHALDPEGKAKITFGPAQFDQAGFPFVPHKLDWGRDGRLYISDIRNGALACIDERGDIVWVRRVTPPSGEDREVWDGFPAHYKKLAATPSSVLCLPEEILVTDQRFQLIYRYRYDGTLLGYRTKYARGEKQWRFRRLGELERLADDRVLLSFPLVRKVVAVGGDFRVAFEIRGDLGRSADGFMGIHGLRNTGDGKFLLTDPALGTIKVFDASDGRYLYDVTRLDGERTSRLERPNMAVADPSGRIWVFLAARKQIVVLEAPPGTGTPAGKRFTGRYPGMGGAAGTGG